MDVDPLAAAGFVVLIGAQAGGLVAFWNRQLRIERKTTDDGMTSLRNNADDGMTRLRKLLDDSTNAIEDKIEALHGRINNIRREFVNRDDYNRDLVRLEARQKEVIDTVTQTRTEILAGIERFSDAVRERLRGIELGDARTEERVEDVRNRISRIEGNAPTAKGGS